MLILDASRGDRREEADSLVNPPHTLIDRGLASHNQIVFCAELYESPIDVFGLQADCLQRLPKIMSHSGRHDSERLELRSLKFCSLSELFASLILLPLRLSKPLPDGVF